LNNLTAGEESTNCGFRDGYTNIRHYWSTDREDETDIGSVMVRCTIVRWVILLNLVPTGYLQFLAIFHNLAGNEHGLLAKTSKTPRNTPK